MSQILTIKDFDSVCRICLSLKDPAILFWNMEIIHMLEACSSVQASMDDDKFPKHICTPCYSKLQICFQFRQQYIISLQILSDIVLKSESNKTESIKNETDEDEKYDIPENYSPLPLEVNIIKTEEDQDYSNETTENKEKVLRKRLPRSVNEKKTEVGDLSETDYFLNDVDDCSSSSNDNIKLEIPEKKLKKKRLRSTSVPNCEDEQTEWICDICGKKFSKKVYMRKHQIIHSDARPFKCYICQKAFKLKWSMKEHVKTIHTERDKRVMCPVCGQLIPPKSVTYHKNKHKEIKEKFKCHLCEKEYTQKSGLRMHINEKHSDNVKMYYCEICSKGFVAKGSLRIHKKFTHTKEKNQSCPICGKSYKKLSDVNAHVNAVHKNLKPHACTVCNKAFSSRSLLKKHMICHTGERPFTCTICGKSFGFKNVLTTHMRVHSK